MAVISCVEKNHPSVDIRAIYKWMREKLDTSQDHGLRKSKVKEDEINSNKYSPKHIAELLPEKDRDGKAVFHFSGISDYITLSSNGQLNARGGEEDLFRAWGSSEFRNLPPRAVLKELEDRIIEINIPLSERDYSFNSYSEFISWLTNQNDKS